MNELSKIAFANIRKIVRPERKLQAVLDWGTGGGMPMGRDVDAGLASFSAFTWAYSLSRSARLATSPWTVLTFLPILALALSSSDWRRPVMKT